MVETKLSSPTAFAKMDYNDLVKHIPESIVRWGLGAYMDPDVFAPIDYTRRGRWLQQDDQKFFRHIIERSCAIMLLAISEKQGQRCR